MKIAKLNIEGYIGGADILSLFSGEETFNLSKLKKFLDSLESDVTDLHIYINSGGGSVTEGWAIYDKLKASGKNIVTIGEGIVGSIATVIYMAGNERKLHENSKFFIHNPYWQPDAPTPMEAGDLTKLAGELKKEEDKILNFYASQTGTPIETIEPLMKQATDLTSAQAIELGFAHSIINESISASNYRLVACVNINQVNNNKKSEMEKTILDEMKAGFNKMQAFFRKAVFKNMEIPAIAPDGAEVKLFIESETEDLTGKNAFVIDTDGNQSVAPDGEYKDASGKVIVVAGGVVESVQDAPAENEENQPTIEDLQAKIAALEAEKAEMQASIEASKAESESAKAEIVAFKNEFETLKNIVIGAGINFETGEQVFNKRNAEQKPETYGDVMLSRFKNK